MKTQRQIVKSPLHLAALLGNLAEVQQLVQEGADVNKGTRENGSAPLSVAAEGGHIAMAQ